MANSVMAERQDQHQVLVIIRWCEYARISAACVEHLP